VGAAPARGAKTGKKKELPTGVIVGRGVSGEARTLGTIEDEVKNVVLAGEIFAPQANKLKSGAYILLLKFADATNGIACKKFIGARGKTTQEEVDAEVERILKAIGKGCSVRIQGKIEYDKFISDYVLFIDSMERRIVPQREDTAEEKRVELHAHTKMSALDAVVPPKTLVETAARWGWPAVAITDHGVVQAFPEAMNTARALKKKGVDIKIIYGMEGYLIDDPAQQRSNHIIFLAKNKTGLYNLYKLVYGEIDAAGGGKFELSIEDVVTGASDLINEVASTKIVGEEETFSHTDLYDFQANVEGARVAYGNVKDLVSKKDQALADKIERQFSDVEKQISDQSTGETDDGVTTYKSYETIATVQKDAGEAPADSDYTEVQKNFSTSVNALGKSLGDILGTVLSSS